MISFREIQIRWGFSCSRLESGRALRSVTVEAERFRLVVEAITLLARPVAFLVVPTWGRTWIGTLIEIREGLRLPLAMSLPALALESRGSSIGRGVGSHSRFEFDALFRLGNSTLRLSRSTLEILDALLPGVCRWVLRSLEGESGARSRVNQMARVGSRLSGDLGKLSWGDLKSLLEEIPGFSFTFSFSLPLTFSTLFRELPNLLSGCGCADRCFHLHVRRTLELGSFGSIYARAYCA